MTVPGTRYTSWARASAQTGYVTDFGGGASARHRPEANLEQYLPESIHTA
jgi:hypothetical protein